MKLPKVLTKDVHEDSKTLILEAIEDGESEFDFSEVEKVDSTAVSILLTIRRSEASAGRRMTLTNVPKELRQLTELYGLGELVA